MITIINFSQRVNGVNDSICDELQKGLTARKVEVRYIKPRDLIIKSCNNCRTCMQSPGDEPGKCHIDDDMNELIRSIITSRSIIVSAPINCYDLPSMMRVILERMSVFCYWPDERYSPVIRKMHSKKKGVLITTSAMPGIMVPFATQSKKTFKLFAKPLNITGIDYHHIGFKGRKADMIFKKNDRKIVMKIVNQLAPRILPA